MNHRLQLRVKSITRETAAIRTYDLRALDGATLPAFTAGAHLDLQLEGGLIRGYSLLNDPRERHRYVIAVALDAASRGGSRWMHERVQPGDILHSTLPLNLFPLDESAAFNVLLAGGIGVTPLLAMAARLQTLGLDWTLYYSVRTRASAAFLDALACYGSRVTLHCDDESDGQYLDLAGIVDAAPPGAHVYCCGPPSMMRSFESAAAAFLAERVHVEYFSPREEAATAGGYVVELAKSARTLSVGPGQSILDALREAGIAVPSSCVQGICGTCETRVLGGIPDHRDSLLGKAERESNRTMMICCSGSLTPRLILDI